MSGIQDPSITEGTQPKVSLHFTTKRNVIEAGLDFLKEAGSDHICQVCIASGGSCCLDCPFLRHGVGCQERNTGCTAWLCGFLKYILYEAGCIQEWKQFWDQVPGKGYREDSTPPYFHLSQWLDTPKNIHFLSEAFAEDLKALKPDHRRFWIFEIREKLDLHIESLLECTDSEIKRKIEKKMRHATKDFQRFHLALDNLLKP